MIDKAIELKRILNFLFAFLFFAGIGYSQKNQLSDYDNIIMLLNATNDETKSKIERLSYAESAKRLSEKIGHDSLFNQSLRCIALGHYNLGNLYAFKKSSNEFLKFSAKTNDSLEIARANLYLGEFYLKKKYKSDSVYYYLYNAEKIFTALQDYENLAPVLSRIAIIQKNEKDYAASEVTAMRVIEYLKPLEDNEQYLSSAYNTLGIIYNELGRYQKSIEYHEKALDLRRNSDVEDLVPHSQNNLAVTLKNAKEYEEASKYFNLLVNNKELREKEPSFYAVLLDNFAHTKFLLNQTQELPGLFHLARKICDSVDNNYATIAINIHLSEFYNSSNQLDSAKYYAYEAKNIAEQHHNDDYLKALLNLSEIEEDSLSVEFYKEYIALNDSLARKEREIRNKFARIRYETKEIELRNERITKERLYLLILSIGLLLTIFLTYSTISQRAKNKELKLKQLQQEANEEIYNLMLSQQDKIEEGRTKEKKRISEELHDGILGRLFGTRLSLDSLNKSIGEDAIENRSVYIEELKSIEQEIRRISHDLSSDFVEGSSYFDMVKTLVENQTNAYKLNYELKKNDDIDWETVSNKTKINLYRIVQESLQNIYKHANANHVSIDFDSVNESIVLEIKDDGIGFDVNKSRKGIGLKNIKSRTEEVKGEISITSEREQGTTIKVKVPK